MTVFVFAVAIVALFAVVLTVNAVRLRPTPVSDPLPESQAMGSDEAVERFREMLRSATVWGAGSPEADHSAFDEFVPSCADCIRACSRLWILK